MPLSCLCQIYSNLAIDYDKRKFSVESSLWRSDSGAYSEPCRTSKIEGLAKIVNG